MSKVKAGGSSKNIHNNPGQRLGVKRFGGQKVNAGEVLVRQTGATKVAGKGAYMSRNYTIHAAKIRYRHLRADQENQVHRQNRATNPGLRWLVSTIL